MADVKRFAENGVGDKRSLLLKGESVSLQMQSDPPPCTPYELSYQIGMFATFCHGHPSVLWLKEALDKNTRPEPRPLFLYGTLCPIPLLAWALTGDATNADLVRNITRDAHVRGYARYTVAGRDYPAVVKDAGVRVDGLLLIPQNRSQRAKLDIFEGEMYKLERVAVTVDADSPQGRENQVDADIYLWNGDLKDISREGWDLETFERERLDDWLELFGGMELVGQDSVQV